MAAAQRAAAWAGRQGARQLLPSCLGRAFDSKSSPPPPSRRVARASARTNTAGRQTAHPDAACSSGSHDQGRAACTEGQEAGVEQGRSGAAHSQRQARLPVQGRRLRCERGRDYAPWRPPGGDARRRHPPPQHRAPQFCAPQPRRPLAACQTAWDGWMCICRACGTAR